MAYKQNSLKNVIIRADFLNALLIDEARIKDICLSSFPIYETEDVQQQGIVNIIKEDGTPEVRIQSDNFKNQIFWNRQRTKRIVISPKYIFFDLYEYTSFSETKIEFMRVFGEIKDTTENTYVKRLGMRYINEIDLTQFSKGVWDKYISKKFLNTTNIMIEDPAFVSSRNMIDLSFNDFRMRLVYGFLNPDLPAIMKRYVFTMDFDAFVFGETNTSQVDSFLNLFHEKIEATYESMIAEKQRDRMGVLADV